MGRHFLCVLGLLALPIVAVVEHEATINTKLLTKTDGQTQRFKMLNMICQSENLPALEFFYEERIKRVRRKLSQQIESINQLLNANVHEELTTKISPKFYCYHDQQYQLADWEYLIKFMSSERILTSRIEIDGCSLYKIYDDIPELGDVDPNIFNSRHYRNVFEQLRAILCELDEKFDADKFQPINQIKNEIIQLHQKIVRIYDELSKATLRSDVKYYVTWQQVVNALSVPISLCLSVGSVTPFVSAILLISGYFCGSAECCIFGAITAGASPLCCVSGCCCLTCACSMFMQELHQNSINFSPKPPETVFMIEDIE